MNYNIKLPDFIYEKYVHRSRGIFGCDVLHGFVAI